MEAKEKAKELVDKFLKGTYPIHSVNIKTIDDVSKQCALICVDEIKEQVELMYPHDHYGQIISYWTLVKQEITQL